MQVTGQHFLAKETLQMCTATTNHHHQPERALVETGHTINESFSHNKLVTMGSHSNKKVLP